jgi:hypothetical protein
MQNERETAPPDTTHDMWRAIALKGVLGWGVPMFLLMTFLVREAPLTVRAVVVGAVIWALAGAVFGFFIWRIQQLRAVRARASGARRPN